MGGCCGRSAPNQHYVDGYQAYAADDAHDQVDDNEPAYGRDVILQQLIAFSAALKLLAALPNSVTDGKTITCESLKQYYQRAKEAKFIELSADKDARLLAFLDSEKLHVYLTSAEVEAVTQESSAPPSSALEAAKEGILAVQEKAKEAAASAKDAMNDAHAKATHASSELQNGNIPNADGINLNTRSGAVHANIDPTTGKISLSFVPAEGKVKLNHKTFVELAWQNATTWASVTKECPIIDALLWVALKEALFDIMSPINPDAMLTPELAAEVKDKLSLEKLQAITHFLNPERVPDKNVDAYLRAFFQSVHSSAEDPSVFWVTKNAFIRHRDTDDFGHKFYFELESLKDTLTSMDESGHVSLEEKYGTQLARVPLATMFSLFQTSLDLLRGGDTVTLESVHEYLQNFVKKIDRSLAHSIYNRIKREVNPEPRVFHLLTTPDSANTYVDLFLMNLGGVEEVLQDTTWGMFLEAALHEALFRHILSFKPPPPVKPETKVDPNHVELILDTGAPTAESKAKAEAEAAEKEAVALEALKNSITYADMLAYCSSLGLSADEAKKRMVLDRGVNRGSKQPEDGVIDFKAFVCTKAPLLFPEIFGAVTALGLALGMDQMTPMRLAPSLVNRKSVSVLRMANRGSKAAGETAAAETAATPSQAEEPTATA
eukprot:gnl/Hemi2/7467_TR2556_c0_g1_i1.p1 gnl/Hemi2/7467_TR2556_c0_g1~~gnl/Hemi2/7467_TR2556_c0_g1_i1.p1  ORF type:complete len:662 (-),score=229.44 gnl/Hemi2/7467_TR2556_c0_g1_i1:153-2138(-)